MSKEIARRLKKEFSRFTWLVVGIVIVLLLLEAGIIYALTLLRSVSLNQWLPVLFIANGFLLAMAIVITVMVNRLGTKVRALAAKAMYDDVRELRSAYNRFRSLQAMASTLRATLSFERVVESALDVCALALEEIGVPSRSIVGGIFLYESNELVPVATRSFIPADREQRLRGELGIIAQSIKHAEPMVTNTPSEDPELEVLLTLRPCKTAICVPLRAGFQIFGAMIIASEAKAELSEEQLDFFNSVADHAVIALQNAKLFQDLKAEKQRIIEADEDARKELARDLHDGPTQSIAAIAMRVNFIRSLINRDPEQALEELDKVERLARETSHEIRGMLFTLRPLVLETEGLAAAIETVIERIHDTHGLPIRLVGGETGDLLDDAAQSVVFSIVEEALGNARKYSKASQVEVRFWREDNLFVAQVQDDGTGFDIESVNENYSSRGSLGMVNMRERAERVDGSVRVESAPGEGTPLTLVIPLEKHGRGRRNDKHSDRYVPLHRY